MFFPDYLRPLSPDTLWLVTPDANKNPAKRKYPDSHVTAIPGIFFVRIYITNRISISFLRKDSAPFLYDYTVFRLDIAIVNAYNEIRTQ